MSESLPQTFKKKSVKKTDILNVHELRSEYLKDKLSNNHNIQKKQNYNTFSNINKVTVQHRLSIESPREQTKYAILLNNKIVRNIESINKFHEVIINATNSERQQLNVIYYLNIDELKKNDMYNAGKYLVVNVTKIYLVTKSKSLVSKWGYNSITSSLIIDKEWTLIEKL